MSNALVKPTLIINGEVVNIVPNSLEVVKGTGTRNVKTQSAGAGQTQNVVFDDVSTKVGMIKFKIYNTVPNMNFIDDIAAITDVGNLVQYINIEGQSGSMNNAIVTNDPSFNLGVDGETEIEMKGSSIQS